MYSPIYRHAALAPQSRVRAHTAAVQQDLHLERKPVPAPARHFACTAGPITCVCASCGTHRTGLNQHGSRGPYHTTIYTTHCLALALYLAALGHTFAHGTHLLSRVVGGETLAHACKMVGGESKSVVPVVLGATALALATALDSATPPFGFAPQQPSYTQAPSPRHLPRTAMHLLCSCHALAMHLPCTCQALAMH